MRGQLGKFVDYPGASYFHLILSSKYGSSKLSPLNLYLAQRVFRHKDIQTQIISTEYPLKMTFQILLSFRKMYEQRGVQEEFN